MPEEELSLCSVCCSRTLLQAEQLTSELSPLMPIPAIFQWSAQDSATWAGSDELSLDVDSTSSRNTSSSEVTDSAERILFAADVIYDDVLTQAFFKTVHKLLKIHSLSQTVSASQAQKESTHSNKCAAVASSLYLAMEKRMNFSVETLAVEATGYRTLLSVLCLHSKHWTYEDDGNPVQYDSQKQSTMGNSDKEVEVCRCNTPGVVFAGRLIPLDFRQYVVEYTRVPELELWKIIRLK